MSIRTLCLVMWTALTALAAAPLSAQHAAELDNVAAFARLYGVARWFYPSDPAAALDWNLFAVDGVRRVRSARTPAELEKTLEQLFTPLGPGIEIGASLPPQRAPGARNSDLVAWHYRGPGFSEVVSGAYSTKRINRTVTAPTGQQSASSIISQAIAADSLRGRDIRMRGRVRIASANAQGWAGLWLRVDRGQEVGFFDNMQDRPVRDTTWREYVIQGTIAADATRIVFGALGIGEMSLDVDAIEIDVRSAGGAWTPLAVRDAGFEESESSAQPSWGRNQPAAFARPASGAPQGERYLRIARAPTASATSTVAARASDSLETPITGAVSEFALARGLRARVPLSLTDAEARAELPALADLRSALAAVPPPAGSDDIDVRLADAVIAWSVFRHFYPYWSDITNDWDARLRPQLAAAHGAASTRQAHVDALRSLVADLNDGHGSVRDVATPQRMAPLPLQFRILANQLVVTASRDSTVPVGSVITSFDGTPASTRVLMETRLASGTPQWKRTRAEGALQLCRLDVAVKLRIEPPNGTARDLTLPCARTAVRLADARPDSITELEPGIWYVDLTRVLAAQLRPMLQALAKARGVVFDMRGYPTDAGAAVLPHLMRTPEDTTDRWMHVPRFARPFAEVAGWQDMTWSLAPTTPLIAGERVFLTDGRAISYAESVMGYVRDYKLGTIIGGTTAGANGNIASFNLPGGFSVVFTGMRVSRHDGRTAFHTAGVGADIPLEPTLEGIRAGRDEVLARALNVLRIQPW